MRICVLSPHTNNNGNSTLSMLIGLQLASQNRLTCITHSKPTSNTFKTYLNFDTFEDKTSTPSQIVRILREGEISGEAVRDYCKSINEYLEVFTNESSNFTQEDMDFMFKYIAKYFPHENGVFDVDSTDINTNRKVIKMCDVVILNITQSKKELSNFKENREEYLKLLYENNKPIVVVVNMYDSRVCTFKEAANWMGIKRNNNWTVLHYNPYIKWATGHGKLNVLFNNIVRKDSRVIELQSDLNKIVKELLSVRRAKDKTGR